MAQQLNLYDRSLRPVRQWLTPMRLFIALLLVLALLALTALGLKRDAARWRAEAAAHDAQLRQLAAAQQQLATDTELPRLREALAQARLMAEALRPAEAGPPDQGARVLAALSAAAQAGVWIDAAQWQAHPRQLALEGGLLASTQLPAYLRRLEREPAFAGQSFSQLQLRPSEGAAPAHHRFVLRSQPKESVR